MIQFIDWGLIPYSQAYEKQKEYFEAALQRKVKKEQPENTVIYCEHPHVITVGKNGLFSNLLFPEQTLKEKGVNLFHVDRGGDITYHGPGQIVAYPVFDLDSFSIGLKDYIGHLEEVIIQTIGEYGIKGGRLTGATGVWIDQDIPGKARKIAAIGVRSSRYVTMHGFALNVLTDLSYFGLINPCGFTDKGVTSLSQELGRIVDPEDIKHLLSKSFAKIFP